MRFNGWADKFLATPNAGLDDRYATVKFALGKWNLNGVLHDFAAESGAGDFGSGDRRIGGAQAWRTLWPAAESRVLLRGRGLHAGDTDKFWLMLTASY